MKNTLIKSARKFIRQMLASPIKENTLKTGRDLAIVTVIAICFRFGKITIGTIEYSGVQIKIDFTYGTILVMLFLIILYLSIMYGFLLRSDRDDFGDTLEEKFDDHIQTLINSQEERDETVKLFRPDPDRPVPSEEGYSTAIAKVNAIDEEIAKASNYLKSAKRWVSINAGIIYLIGTLPLIAAVGALVLIATFFFA